ncbi:MAG: MFS transporter [Candidatus Brocadiia bacterium]
MNSHQEPDLTEKQKKAGMLHAHIGQSTGLLVRKFLVSTSVGPLFVKAMGGSDVQAMLLGGVVWGGTLLRIPISLNIPQSRGKDFMLKLWGIAAVLYLLALAIPSLMGTGTITAWLFLLLAVGGLYCQHAGTTFWWPLLHDVVPEQQRGEFFGILRTIWQLVLFCAVLAAGLFLGADPPLWKFQVVLITAIALMVCRNFFVARIPERQNYSAEVEKVHWKVSLKQIFNNRPAMLFFAYFAIFTFFVNFFHLPVVLYMNNRLNFSVSNNTMIFGFKILGMVLALFLVGRTVDKIGTKRVFVASHLLSCIVAFAIIVIGIAGGSHTKPLMIAILVLSGTTVASAGLAATAQVFHLAPVGGRALFMNSFAVCLMAGYSLAPTTAGLIIDLAPDGWALQLWNYEFSIYETLFGLSGIMLVLGLFLLRGVDDMKAEEEI